MGDQPTSPYSGDPRAQRHHDDYQRSPRQSPIHSSPHGARTFERSVPMSIARSRPEEPPPPLPPPRMIDEYARTKDLGFQWANHGLKAGARASVPLTSSLAGSSLSGPRVMSRRESEESDSPVYQRKNSSAFPVRTIPSLESFAFQHPPDEGYGSMSGSSITNQIKRETPLEVKNRQNSSHAYDSNLLSRLGRPRTPTQNTPTLGSLEGSPTSRRPSLHASKPHPKNLSLSERSLSGASEPLFKVGSPFSSKWASSPQSQSGPISPGYTTASTARSPGFDESAATSPGIFSGTSEDSDRFGRRSIAQHPRIKRSDSSLSIAMSAMSTSASGAANEYGSIGGSVSGSISGGGGVGAAAAGNPGASRGGQHVGPASATGNNEQQIFFSSSFSEEGDEEPGMRHLNLDDRPQSHSSSLPQLHQQQQQQQLRHQQHSHAHSHSANSATSSSEPTLQPHRAAQPHSTQSQLQRPIGFAPQHAHHPTLIAPQPPPPHHQAPNQPQNYNAAVARHRHRASHSRSSMPNTRPLEEDDEHDDRGAAGGAPASKQPRLERRVSPVHNQPHPSQASYTSQSSASLSNGSYSSSTGPAGAASSLSSIASHNSRLSPSNLPPPPDRGNGPSSPYSAQTSHDSARTSNLPLSLPHPHPQQPPPPTQQPLPSMSAADVQATAAAAQSMAADPSVRPQQPQANAPQLQASLHICDCCPKKPKKFDTLEELQQHQAEKQYYCQYCHNRFKNKNEAERHQNSLHLRRHSWSCATLDRNYHTAFHASTAIPPNAGATHSQQQQAQQNQSFAEHDICGYCGEKFPNIPAPDWVVRSQHLTTVHKFGECNQSKKFYRADHFRQHLKHSHGGQSGKWTNMLENACMREEPPLTPDGGSQEQIRSMPQPQSQPSQQPAPQQQQPGDVLIQAQQAAQAAQAAAQAAQAAQAVQAQQRQQEEKERPALSQAQASALQNAQTGAPVASMGGYSERPNYPASGVQYSTINEEQQH